MKVSKTTVNNATDFRVSHEIHFRESLKPLITARKEKFWINFFDLFFDNLIKSRFYAIRFKNKENFNLRNNNYPNIMYGFHSCWWDGIIAYYILKKLYDLNLYMMIEELYRFPVLSNIGAFSIEKNSPQEAVKSLNYAIKLLKNKDNTLWIFPQGRIFPPDYRPIVFEGGLSYICKKLKGVNLIPVTYRYTFWRQDRPELFLEVGKPIIIESFNGDRKEFIKELQFDYTKLIDNQIKELSSGIIDDYEFLFENKKCWFYYIEPLLRPILRRK